MPEIRPQLYPVLDRWQRVVSDYIMLCCVMTICDVYYIFVMHRCVTDQLFFTDKNFSWYNKIKKETNKSVLVHKLSRRNLLVTVISLQSRSRFLQSCSPLTVTTFRVIHSDQRHQLKKKLPSLKTIPHCHGPLGVTDH